MYIVLVCQQPAQAYKDILLDRNLEMNSDRNWWSYVDDIKGLNLTDNSMYLVPGCSNWFGFLIMFHSPLCRGEGLSYSETGAPNVTDWD